MSKVILVTGANQGIGYEVVRQLATQGHTVYLGARNAERGQAAVAKLHEEKLASVKFLLIDVTSQESVDAAHKQFSSEQSHLDVLVNNAGICPEAMDTPAAAANVDTMKIVFETNFFGVVRVTNAFLPIVKKSKNPSILNVSSSLGSVTRHADPAAYIHKVTIPGYNASKSALNAYSVNLAASVPEVRINVICPGFTSTNLNNYKGHFTPQASAAGVVKYGILVEDNAPTARFLSHDGTIIPW